MDENSPYYKKFKRVDSKMDSYYRGLELLREQKRKLEMTQEEKDAERLNNYLKQNPFRK